MEFAKSSSPAFEGRGSDPGSVARNAWIDGTGPVVNAADERLDVIEAPVAQPHGDRKGAGAMMAKDDDGGVRIEFGGGAAWDLVHGDERGAGQGRSGMLPGLANIEQQGWVWLGAKCEKLLRSDFWRKHSFTINAVALGGMRRRPVS